MYKKSLLNHTKLYLGPFNLNWAILTYVELADHPVVYWKISLTRGIIFQYTMGGLPSYWKISPLVVMK